MSKLRSYHFSCGNSTSGTVRFCARINAHSKTEAVEILREETRSRNCREHELVEGLDREKWEYLSVYFNVNAVSTRHIDEIDEIDDVDKKDGDAT